jgi:hypothetical protein
MAFYLSNRLHSAVLDDEGARKPAGTRQKMVPLTPFGTMHKDFQRHLAGQKLCESEPLWWGSLLARHETSPFTT